jgi:hypothetical protein
VLPGHKRDVLQQGNLPGITFLLLQAQQIGQNGRVIVDDSVGDQPAALAPDLLLMLRLEPQLAEIGTGYGAP